MNNGREIIARLRRYLWGWGIGFILLCIISIIKNWDVLIAAFSVLITNVIISIAVIAIFVYIVRSFLR